MVPVIYIDSVFMILPWNLYVADSILPFVQMLGRNIFMKLVSKIRCELKKKKVFIDLDVHPGHLYGFFPLDDACFEPHVVVSISVGSLEIIGYSVFF